MPPSSSQLVAAIDQGTTSTRCILFDHSGRIVSTDQREHRQLLPGAGLVEHDAMEIWANTRQVVAGALARADVNAQALVAVGITNQRETTVVWDRSTGQPIHPAIVWQDTRTQDLCTQLAADGGGELFRARTGLPLATYFAGPKIRWILDQVPQARRRAEAGELLAGTIDSWLLWNLTGGVDAGRHLTDVTNASRTLLMDLRTLQWDADLCARMGVPMAMLPTICSSVHDYGSGRAAGVLSGVPIGGVLGDQHAATFGQTCFEPGMGKNTYGTGNFMLLNTGTEPVLSNHGLLTTVGYQIGGQPAVYALEGAIAVTGSLVQWLRDNLGLIESAGQIESLAAQVPDNGGAYIVPAFSGLFAPYWRPDARGVVVGLTRFVNRAHLARAALEATAFQTWEVVEAMRADAGVDLHELRVDGGMVGNELLMQFQADILGVDVVRPTVRETTALGAAYAAGLGVGFWTSTDELTGHWAQDARWQPAVDQATRDRLRADWRRAVQRTFDWA